MHREDLLHPENPRHSLLWSIARDEYQLKKRTVKHHREIRSVNVADVCDKLTELLTDGHQRVNSQTFFRASMMASGAIRLHNKQTEILLEDTKKLLDTMRREKRAVEKLDDKLDCMVPHTTGAEPGILELLDEADLEASPRAMRPARPPATTLSATAVSAARAQLTDWGALDGDIDWTLGLPRACPQQITLPDVDVPHSSEFVARLEQLRAVEESFEGPTLLDWEEEVSRGGSPKPAVEMSDQSITEAPADTLAPMAAEQPQIVLEAAADILPRPGEEAELSAAPEPADAPEPQAEEQPSQIELAPLEDRQERERKASKTRRGKPVIDPILILSTEAVRRQIQYQHDTLRNRNANEDVINLESVKWQKADLNLLSLVPAHRRVMADALLELFRPCEDEAAFPGPGSPLHEIIRGATSADERDVSGVPSLLQDTSSGSFQRSRSTFLEVPTGLFEDAPLVLEPIEELEAPPSATLPPPPPPEDLAPPARKEPTTEKPKRTRKDRSADADKTTQPSRDSDASKSPVEGPEPGREELAELEREEVDLSELHDLSLAEPEAVARMVLDHLATHQEALFNDLLPQDPTDKEAGHMFDTLLQMYKDSKVWLLQDEVFGPIRVKARTSE